MAQHMHAKLGDQRVTKQRLAVSTALDNANDFMSTQELHRTITEAGGRVSLATTYRILQAFADAGLVDVLRGGDGEAIYRRCEAEQHHHHVLCRQCGTAVEIQAPEVEKWAQAIAAKHGFTEVNHTVEIMGLCATCQRANSASA
ncbi:Fur family transcriptional regulator [Haematomicrobium sanguinis]|uniref:Fur family transcriptional regulator n=1 Tax=Haematomicrobium sanguinis TaxID=479106 RepID=UPI00047DBF5C|nr:Fur family transcriptional regulator [Haematomicrobium sanguinis]